MLFRSHPAAGDRGDARLHPIGQGRRVGDVEAQLDRGRQLVDILPARPGGADEAFAELILVQPDADGDFGSGRQGGASIVAPLAAIGAGISLYHWLLERFPDNLDSGVCSKDVPCEFIWFELFGFVTLPFMALTGFLAIIVFNTLPTPTE